MVRRVVVIIYSKRSIPEPSTAISAASIFSVAKMQVNRSEDSILYRSGMNAKIKCNFQVFTACDFVASTIAIIPTLIAAGSVAHEAMTAIKSGSL